MNKQEKDAPGVYKKKGAGQIEFGNVFGPDTSAEDDANRETYGGKKGSVNSSGRTMPGFNFMPPKDGKDTSTLQKGNTLSRKYGNKPDYASVIYDADQDGDNILNDSNNDGTMVGRGIDKVKNFLTGASQQMGFTQNFGAARQNSYAKGAAKVNSIMNSFGGAAKGVKDADTMIDPIADDEDGKK